jgi:hypothetical protein
MRILKFIAIVAAFMAGSMTIADMTFAIMPNFPETTMITLQWIYFLTFAAAILPKVGYRSIDMLMLFIPGWGIYVFVRAMWRLSGLPNVDWPTRDRDPEPKVRVLQK